MRPLLFLFLAVALVGGGWLYSERNHIAISPSASDWEPPVAPAPQREVAARSPCSASYPEGRAWFGDLHVHTGYSMDARSRDMLGTPDDAYRFARGEVIGLGPFDAERRGARQVQLDVPLDFAAVTDHAEWIGEIVVCTEPGTPGYDSNACSAYRGEAEPEWSVPVMVGGKRRMVYMMGFGDRNADVCGPGNAWCREGALIAWQNMQRAAEQHYDRSADCSFTTFHGYEYSNSAGQSKIHRNIIYRNELVPELPVSSLEEPDPFGLWEKMDVLCGGQGSACEAISIPHNPNVSNGRTFRIPWRDEPLEEQRRLAELRLRYEPIVEMMQVKGESECKSGLWQIFGEDELCDFEKIRGLDARRPEDCKDDYSRGAIFGRGCESRLDFARYALAEGMAEEARIGVNPYRFGFVGSTDSHNAAPGDVDEDNYDGCCANTDNDVQARLDAEPGFAGAPSAMRNPGGLMGVWAPENTRDALFDAMQRREVFATSGPRIEPRFFAGSDIPEDACTASLVTAGYAGGVPMGGVLDTRFTEAPVFAVAASADPRGGLLQRLQVVKVWHDGDGGIHQSVADVAGSADNGAAASLEDCSVSGPGHRQLCATWRDPAFDPDQPAAYYLRVLENPSCRWSWRQCLSLPEGLRPLTCEAPDIQKIIQERAWSSPIWYAPS